MPTDWNALAKLGSAAFKKKDASAAVVVRKVKPPVPEIPFRGWPVMFPDDALCPEWLDLVAWARTAPIEAFEILPHRAPHKDGKGLRFARKESLRLAILEELAEAGGAMVVGLIYELRTLKARWEGQPCES